MSNLKTMKQPLSSKGQKLDHQSGIKFLEDGLKYQNRSIKGSKSIDNILLLSKQNDRIKSAKQSPDIRIQTDEGNNTKKTQIKQNKPLKQKQVLKQKHLSLATVSLNQKESVKPILTSKQSQNFSPSGHILTSKQKTQGKDQYLFDMNLLKNFQLKQHNFQQNNSKPNKQSILSDTSKSQRKSIEDMIMNQRILKGSAFSLLLKNKKCELDQKSLNVGNLSAKLTPQPKSQSKTRLDSQIQYDKKKQLQIILYYKQFKYYFLFEYQNKTTDDLFNYLIQQIACIEKKIEKGQDSTGSTVENKIQEDLKKICQFQSIQKNIPYDYYLSLDNYTLDVFEGIVLQLQPLLSQSTTQKKVGLKDFQLIKCIGVGGFSRVYLVRKKDNGKFYALKLIDKQFIIENQKEIIVQNERDIMVKMDNQYVTPLQFAFETKFYVAFVLDYCAGGELFYHLRKLKRLNEDEAQYYFVEICIGMAYLHSQNIIYRDIKPENILLDLQGHLLLSDFGLSKPDMSPDDFAYSFCGSPEYMAPEMLMKTGHNYLVDCYCLGALLYELVCGLPPFYSHNTQEIYNSILTEKVHFPEYVQISSELQDLIESLLTKDPTQRLGQNEGIVEILTHPWFSNVDFEAIVNKTIQPPYKPDSLQYNFDEEEFNKGDLEFRKQYVTNLQNEFQNVDNAQYELNDFYYQKPDGKENNQRIKNVNINQLQNQVIQIENFNSSKTPFNQKQQQQQLKHSPQQSKKIDNNNVYLKKNNLLKKSQSLLFQSLKLGHAYSKTFQHNQISSQELKKLRQLIDQSRAMLSSDRLTTLPEQSKKQNSKRVKTEQIGQISSPKTTTHRENNNKNIKYAKLFGSEKKKK